MTPESYDMEELIKKIKGTALEGRINFTGVISDSDMDDVFRKTRLFVNASSFEGFGMVAIEMMGSGIPAVVPDNSAQKEVTRGHATYYNNATDSDELANAIMNALTNPIPLSELKSISQEMKENYSVDVIGKKYVDAFHSMLKKSH